MFVYSKNIIRFVGEIKHTIKEVISREIGLKVITDRFCDRLERVSYPIKVVIFNNKSMLGYFDPNFYELGFHECLMRTSKEQLRNVIRHELAHYMTFNEYGGGIQPHAAEFRGFCRRVGWGEEVYHATFCLETGEGPSLVEENSVLRKIQKLMSLATSSNENEAEQAMVKSQQLLLKHNIDSTFLGDLDEEKVFLKRIMKQKKDNAKMRAIANILETFFVSSVYVRAGDYTYLEILGTSVNVEIAEYVANFLQNELENLWDHARLTANLTGMIAKNSFFIGIALGYCNKIKALKRDYPSDVTDALMVIEKALVDAKAMVYQRLTTSKRSGRHCQESSALGEQMGRQLNINPAISKTSNNLGTLIGYS